MTRTPPTRDARFARLSVIRTENGVTAISGPVSDLAAVLEHLHNTGSDVTATSTNELRITLPATPATPTGPISPARPARRAAVIQRPRWLTGRRALIGAAVLAVAAGVTGLVLAVAMAVAWLIAHLAAIGAAAVVIVVLAAVTGGGACTTVIRITHHH